MKQFRNILPLAAALLAAACGGESNLPNPGGKATVRAINAISASSTVDFRIEERSLAGLEYREISAGEEYDDFSYTFNFDIRYAGDDETTRLASETIQFVADQDYTLLLSGTVDAPTITVWEFTEREFADGATVFQARFAHTADSLAADSIDIYFAPDGTVPVAGEQVATLSFGEVSAAMDFTADDYVTTITRAGDVNDVLFVSTATTLAALGDVFITPFDGTPNELAPLGVFILGANGVDFEMSQPNSPALVQFLHGAADAGDVDVYDDDALTSLVYDDLTYQQLTPEQTISDLAGRYLFTPFDSTGSIIVQRDILARGDRRYRMYLTGAAGEYALVLDAPDRRPVDTAAKVIFTNVSQGSFIARVL